MYWNSKHGFAIKFYIDDFQIINGIPYEEISGNGRKRSLEKIDDYLSIKGSRIQKEHVVIRNTGPVFSYKLRYIVGFWLVEMAISTNQKPTIYRNLYENTAPDVYEYNLGIISE